MHQITLMELIEEAEKKEAKEPETRGPLEMGGACYHCGQRYMRYENRKPFKGETWYCRNGHRFREYTPGHGEYHKSNYGATYLGGLPDWYKDFKARSAG